MSTLDQIVDEYNESFKNEPTFLDFPKIFITFKLHRMLER
jgi:hypothetical protein